ncbi:MAG TPA: hypothetical protein VHM88_25605, partial [Candidatus Acidoferrales bacterium]|nr:hypothetical protein [Candidatus Acidoferrales bacterium]
RRHRATDCEQHDANMIFTAKSTTGVSTISIAGVNMRLRSPSESANLDIGRVTGNPQVEKLSPAKGSISELPTTRK